MARFVPLIAALLLVSQDPVQAQAERNADVFGEFVGSTPGVEPFGKLFEIPADANPPVKWALTLHQDPRTQKPTTYKLRAEYDTAKPPAARKPATKEKEGKWAVGKGTKADATAVVYELDQAVSFVKVSDDLLHTLNADKTLAVGNGGWSYSLNRTTAAEKVVIPSAEWGRRSEASKIDPIASGKEVFAVFEGRTPAQGIARELKITTDTDRFKVKWRVTLYQNPDTKQPTTYKVEGSLHRGAKREGKWSIDRRDGTEVYHLAATKTEADLYLLKGDNNVMFFLDQKRKPMVGHEDFSYTLNWRDPTQPPK